MKRKPVRSHTEGRTRDTHATWPVTDASDWLGVETDEPADPDGLGEEVTVTVSTARVVAAPRTPTKAEREEHGVSHVPYGQGPGKTPPDTECLLTTHTSAGTRHHC